MTREQYDQLSAPLLRVVNDMEDDILRLIGQQLGRDGNFSDTSKWRMRQLARAGKLDKQAAALIAKYSGIQSALLAEAAEIAALTEIGYVDNAVADLQRQGLLAGVPELPAEKSAVDAYKAFQAQAQSDLNLVNTVMQYKARSSFVAAVNAAYHESQKSRQAALDVMGKHAAGAMAGHMSLQEATRRCIRQLAERGIPAFVDKAGREWSPEAYVMMDMRSTLGNTARAAQDMRCDKYGFNLIEVSSHMGARPLCAKFQGKIYSRDGSRGITMDGRGDKIYFTPLSETSYGEPAGLFGINCGHVQYPFAEGCSFQRYFPYPEEENSKRYRQFQQQRYLERQVRASKRECMMLNETGDKEGFAKASARLKARKKQYANYCNKTGLKMHNDRTQVYGFDRSVSAKTTWANRKAQPANKMASASSDWSGALPQSHTAQEMAEICEYAKARNVKIYLPNTFDGDIDILREQIDTIHNLSTEYLLNQKITIRFDTMLDDVFAETTGNTIAFNKKALRNREITNKILNSDKQLAATDVSGIAVHEMGHIITQKYGEKGLDIARKAYYNIYKKDISTNDLLWFLRENVSYYAIFVPQTANPRNHKHKEIIPEILSKSKSSNSNDFSDEYIKLLKEAFSL